MKWLLAVGLCACANQAAPVTAAPSPCDGIRGKVETLYRAEATLKEPKRIEAATADNTRMVLADCAKAPARVAPCVTAAATVAELETKCLLPLSEDGTEGSP